MIKTKLLSFLVMVVLFFAITGQSCQNTSDDKDRRAIDNQQEHYRKVQPVPFYDFSQERDAMMQIYNSRNENVRTWSVWRSDYGIIEGCEPTIGYPIPYDVQLTNPLQDAHNQGAVIEQAEPNGLFSSKTTSATWIRVVVETDKDVVITPVYIEGKVTCYPYPVEADYENNRVVRVKGSRPNVEIKDNKPK